MEFKVVSVKKTTFDKSVQGILESYESWVTTLESKNQTISIRSEIKPSLVVGSTVKVEFTKTQKTMKEYK